MQPLTDIRVLDLSTSCAAAWCSRLLADHGAEVLLVAERDTLPLSELAPFDDAGNSIAARYLHAGKHYTTSPRDLDALQSLIRECDVVITSERDVALAERRLDYSSLAAINPSIIHCAITPFGLTGRRAGWAANDLSLFALSGWASLNGLRSGPPLKGSGFQASYQTGTMSYASIICALIHRQLSGEGQQIDVAGLDVLCSTFSPALLGSACRGVSLQRRATVDITGGPVPVRDGYFALTISRPHFWIEAMNLLGLPDLAASEDLQQSWYRQRHREEFADRVEERMTKWNRMDLFEALAARRVIAGPVLTMEELGGNEHLRARDFFVRPEERGETPEIEFPGPPFVTTPRTWRLRHSAPRERTGFAARNGSARAAQSRNTDPHSDGPLSGYRGIVLTQAWAGSYATQLMALAGAEVVQVEFRERPDSWRGQYNGPKPALLEGREEARHPWNCNPLFNSVNLNKESLTLNLSSAEGIAVFEQLVTHADFVAENFSPRVMGNLGIGYERLRELRPDIILLSLSAYGHSGPWSNVPGIGGTLEPTSGMSALLGYEGGAPLNSGQMYPDAVAGICGFAALASALLYRERTREGQFIDLSMQEANFTFVGDAWMEYAVTGEIRSRLGNRHQTFAPHGIYPSQGDDRWVAIAAETDAQWAQLCTVAEHPAWLTDPRFATAALRKEHEEQLDALLTGWTQTCERHELAERLADVGVIAAPVLDPLEVGSDAELIERRLLVAVDHPETGRWIQPGAPFRMSSTPPRVRRHAPLQGADGAEVLKRLLGFTDADYESLVDRGISGSGPVES